MPSQDSSHALPTLVGEGEVRFLKDKGCGEGFLVNLNLKNKKGTKIFIRDKPNFLTH